VQQCFPFFTSDIVGRVRYVGSKVKVQIFSVPLIWPVDGQLQSFKKLRSAHVSVYATFFFTRLVGLPFPPSRPLEKPFRSNRPDTRAPG